MYLIRDGRIVQRHYITGLMPVWTGRYTRRAVVVHEGFIDCGPAPQPTRKDRALMAMQRMERKGQTDRTLYDVARKIAIHEVVGV